MPEGYQVAAFSTSALQWQLLSIALLIIDVAMFVANQVTPNVLHTTKHLKQLHFFPLF